VYTTLRAFQSSFKLAVGGAFSLAASMPAGGHCTASPQPPAPVAAALG